MTTSNVVLGEVSICDCTVFLVQRSLKGYNPKVRAIAASIMPKYKILLGAESSFLS